MKQTKRVDAQNCIFFECDMQDKLGHLMINFSAVLQNAARFAQISKILDIPLISTYQVKFGPIAEQVSKHYPEGHQTFEKSTFSMLDDQVKAKVAKIENRKVAVLYGAEAQVCIRQTALDLIEMGFDVHLIVDTCTSMSHHDRNIAIESMRDAGVVITSFQAMCFELLRDSKHPKFKEMLGIIKQNPESALDLHYYTK